MGDYWIRYCARIVHPSPWCIISCENEFHQIGDRAHGRVPVILTPVYIRASIALILPWHGNDWTQVAITEATSPRISSALPKESFIDPPPLTSHIDISSHFYTQPTFWAEDQALGYTCASDQIRRQQCQLWQHNCELQYESSWIQRGRTDYSFALSTRFRYHTSRHAHELGWRCRRLAFGNKRGSGVKGGLS